MPLFEYRCGKCGEEFEELESYEDRDKPQECPACGAKNSERLMSVFAASGTSCSCNTCKPTPT